MGSASLEEAFGVEVVESRHALADKQWLAAHPEALAADLMEALKDPAIQGIVSIIGGDDSIRMAMKRALRPIMTLCRA